MLNLAAIVGPTAVGKTSISIELARLLNAEIISCDSMQIYKGMDIGTAKANIYERSLAPHHMIDIVEPDIDFTVADYQDQVKKLIAEINLRNKLPILVGGTGLYYQAVVDDYDFFPMESRVQARQKWEGICDKKGIQYAYTQVQKLDPEYALKIGPKDRKRIIRALEVYEITGVPFSCFQNRNINKYNLAVVGLYVDRQQLYQRIETRVDEMIKMGLIDEVITLRKRGWELSLNSMQALGYKQVIYYLQGLVTRDEMIKDIKKETRHFAKRQFTWFNKDKRIHWINLDEWKDNQVLIKNIYSYIAGQLGKA